MAPIAVILSVLVLAGCAGIGSSPSREPQTGVPQGKIAAVEPPVAKAPAPAAPARPEPVEKKGTAVSRAIKTEEATPKAEPAIALTSPSVKAPAKVATSPLSADRDQMTERAAPAAVTKEAPTPGTDKSVAKTQPPAARVPAGKLAEPARAEADRKKETAAAPAKQGPPPLDLKTLEQRLKDTDAIGVFTKLTLKNQVDDLLEQFRAYHQGRVKTTLAQLRKPYEQLILKVQSLLMEGDSSLANAIMASREAIWNILADPAKFAKL